MIPLKRDKQRTGTKRNRIRTSRRTASSEGTVKTIASIQIEQKDAERELVQILSDAREPKSTREIVGLSYSRGQSYSSDTIRRAAWSLIDRGKLEFTPDRRLRLK